MRHLVNKDKYIREKRYIKYGKDVNTFAKYIGFFISFLIAFCLIAVAVFMLAERGF